MSKMVKKKSENLENLKKSQKNTLTKNEEKINFAEKNKIKCYPLSFPILGGHESTRALQSSPFLISGGGPLRATEDEEKEEEGNPCV